MEAIMEDLPFLFRGEKGAKPGADEKEFRGRPCFRGKCKAMPASGNPAALSSESGS
jgi:hypothetical protein